MFYLVLSRKRAINDYSKLIKFYSESSRLKHSTLCGMFGSDSTK